MNEYCAALDFGTNTARLLIARCSSAGIIPVHVEREIVRLGGGFTDHTGLSDDAQARGLACLHRFSRIISEYGVGRISASATSAVRDAVNGRAFVEKVFHETGITLNVIDGDTEARLTLAGVRSSLDSECNRLVVLDVGGGSTEFTIAIGGAPVFIKSMPIGVVRLMEGFRSVDEMRVRVSSVINLLVKDIAIADCAVGADFVLVGTAGTATTVAAIMLEMEDYDYRRINNYIVNITEMRDLLQRLLPLTPQERLLIKGLEKGREDLIIAGLLIMLAVMETFCITSLKVSDFGLLEGLALSVCEAETGTQIEISDNLQTPDGGHYAE
jgi:exopolyphosphatase/guanosine-5'-triphosphate,3'-diphosphate pyrophosphatase